MADRVSHIVLLGDSVLDNGAYTRGEPDVVQHLRSLMPRTWQATLRAVDGSTTAGLPVQAEKIPADASHLVIAIGGDNAPMDTPPPGTRGAPTAPTVPP